MEYYYIFNVRPFSNLKIYYQVPVAVYPKDGPVCKTTKKPPSFFYSKQYRYT
jgi:hypothetical protein